MKKWQCAVLALTMLVLLVGCTGNEKKSSETGTKTFAEWSEYEAFANVPALITEHTRISQAHDAGGENYVIDVSSTVLMSTCATLRTKTGSIRASFGML